MDDSSAVHPEEAAVPVAGEFIVLGDHTLATPDGKPVEQIKPHPNVFDNNPNHFIDPKYILMHYTTGPRMESTIAYVQRGDAKGCAHLLIGREGRVVQFVPFNKVAYHAGFSWWEGDTNLNRYSIGIELDNAGELEGGPGNWTRKKAKPPELKIPDADVEIKTYWRDLSVKPKAWEKFRPIQLEVLENILQAFVDHYGGPEQLEILGHDDVNLAFRIDPGPLFPMEAIREKVFGRRLPRYKVYHLAKDASLYTHECTEESPGTVPDPDLLEVASSLPAGAQVKVLRQEGEKWSFVNILKSSNNMKGSGWLRTGTLKPEGNKKKTNAAQMFYPKFQSPPCLKITFPSFPQEPRIRIQEVRGPWSLIVMLDHYGMEGWVETKYISAV